MIRLGDSQTIAAFQARSSLPDATRSVDAIGSTEVLAGDFLSAGTSIVSDVQPASRGLSVSQHAAQVLSHLRATDAA